jgi:putative transposase
LVDTLGLVWAALVHPANEQDRTGARALAHRCSRQRLPRVQRVWADGGYTSGPLEEWLWRTFRWVLDIVKPPADLHQFEVLPHRWIVERTFAWFGHFRRLSMDYEFHPATEETMIYLAMSHIMLRRLART